MVEARKTRLCRIGRGACPGELELTPADEDVVDVGLSLLDRLTTPANVLIADRHYQYKAVERWRDQLVERGIEQIFDLRADQHGFTELNPTRWAAGWPHCPATPDHYGTIARSAPNAAKKDKETFRRRINLRQQYAFRRVTSPDADGTARWECPAVAGSIGCPLRPGSVEAHMELGGTIIDNPPDRHSPDFPTCCAQRTVTLKPGPLRKLMQEATSTASHVAHRYHPQIPPTERPGTPAPGHGVSLLSDHPASQDGTVRPSHSSSGRHHQPQEVSTGRSPKAVRPLTHRSVCHGLIATWSSGAHGNIRRSTTVHTSAGGANSRPNREAMSQPCTSTSSAPIAA